MAPGRGAAADPGSAVGPTPLSEVVSAVWSPKGGVGVSATAAMLAVAWAARAEPTLVVDLQGDQPALLGIDEPEGPGFEQWCATGDPDPKALARIETPIGFDLALVHRGSSPVPARATAEPQSTPSTTSPSNTSTGRSEAVTRTAGSDTDPGGRTGTASEASTGDPAAVAAALDRLRGDSRHVVVDCGRADRPISSRVAAQCEDRLIVVRLCYLTLRAAQRSPIDPTGVVLIREPGRALGRSDVESVIDAPVVADIALDQAVARCIDAGLVASRLPRSLLRRLARVAPHAA